ncbi:MAG TPA: gliding motility-associated C-terminal domain-containing protein [Brumimicrobium sp.]|nr:gliding motility-associated C-terminal domain-containing protein [Brumimicrobium sp.]
MKSLIVKLTFLMLTTFLITNTAKAQSDDCLLATNILVTSSCMAPTQGSSAGATESISGCVGNADDDVWYTFVATSNAHQIRVGSSIGYDAVLQVFSGSCSSLVSLGCVDNGGSGQAEVFNYSNYVVGQTYRMRIYHYWAGSGSGNFTVCVTNAPPPPANDFCGNAIPLNVSSLCTFRTFSNMGASESFPGCSGNSDDDVWFKFVATNAVQEINVNPISSLDLVVQLYSGACNSTSLICQDNAFTGGMETINAVGLIPGRTYYFRVYDYYSGRTGNFEVCVKGPPTSAPTNDNPCSAIKLPVVTSECTYLTFTNVGATASSVPKPTDCDGTGGAGAFNAALTGDVWFEITVPPSGSLSITSQPNMGPGSITDGVMVLYRGTCSSPLGLVCSDDNNYPGTVNDQLPYIERTGLTPGSKVFLRYYGFGAARGKFGLCVSTASNNDCKDALYICDINGYKGSTGMVYKRKHPGNMRGNAEKNNPPAYTWTPGVNQGGVFGKGGYWGTGAPFFDVTIDNNSWIKFTASAATATLNVSIYDCFIGNYPKGGIQMQIFSATNCNSFVPVSNFEESSTGFVITANGLIPGRDYYLMVDGYGGDVCSYTISANTGVLFPNIPSVPSICSGSSTTITAPAGAASYRWTHNGATTRSVSVSPSSTTTYTCEVTGLCDYKQTLQTQVIVKQNPNISFSTGNSTEICAGESLSITAGGASSYTWSTGQSGNTINVTPSSSAIYTVTGVINGCQTSKQVSVGVNTRPSLSANPSATPAGCGLSDGALTGTVVNGTGPYNYRWTTAGGSLISTSANLTGVGAGLYSLNVIDGNGCPQDFGPFNISNPGSPAAPSISVSDNGACDQENVTFTVNSPVPGSTYRWAGPNGFTTTSTSFSVPISQVTQGNYCVSATASNCIGASSCEIITLLPSPNIDINSSTEGSVACSGSDVNLSVSGVDAYTWSGPNNYTNTGSPVVVANITQSDEGWYSVNAIDANGCSSEDSTYVSVVALPNADASADGSKQNSFCEGTVGLLYGSGGESYSWTGPNGFVSNQQNAGIPSFSDENEGTYILTVTDMNDCQDQDSLKISIARLDDFNIIASDTALCPGDDLNLNAEGADTYNWYGPNGFTSTNNPVDILNIGFEQEGVYYVEGVSGEGCYAEDSLEIKVIISRDCLFIPGFTSPNDDGLNDAWVITGIEAFPDAEVSIYNRWGNLAFFASPYENNWIGQVNKGVNIGDGSGKVPTGTYFYVIKLNDGIDEPIKGYIELQY